MTSKFDDFEQEQFGDRSSDLTEIPMESFELISAYIDGELSPDERQQVQQMLDQDPKVKQLYTQLLGLQTSMQSLAAPPSSKSVADLTAGVFESVAQRRRQRRLFWGGGVVAASIVAVITGSIPGLSPLRPRLAIDELPRKADSAPVMLAVGMNQPAINIPKGLTGYEVELPSTWDN
ncbi:MAG: zf-HC2 domain-containing protein [Cyanobacteria bacterium J06621_8]